MITLNKYGDKCNRVYLELYGLSTDTKPIEKFENVFIGNASTFFEMDKNKCFKGKIIETNMNTKREYVNVIAISNETMIFVSQ